MELPSTETTQVDAQSEEWFASYAEPSNQPSDRHRHVRRHRSQHRRRQRIDRLGTTMMILSVVFVGAMTACFYTVLTR
jgi:cytoskeletal protein RodZ